jgi:hydrogenase-4 component B
VIPVKFYLLTISVLWLTGFLMVSLPRRLRDLATVLSLALGAAGAAAGVVLGATQLLGKGSSRGLVQLADLVAIEGRQFLAVEFLIDRLAAFFVLLLSAFGLAVALYSFGFLAEKPNKHRIAACLNLYLWSMFLALTANNAVLLVICMELMTLASVYFILYEHNVLLDAGGESADATRAPQVYLIASHISTVLVAVALFGLAVVTHTFSFDDWRALAADGAYPSLAVQNWCFLIAVVGLGIKAGLVPFHPWLPHAHPNSPANIHALLSGMMIKVPIYVLLRILFEFLGPGAWWWGVALLAVAGVTALVGVFYAIFNSNLKAALAYHSVEHVGIILAGIAMAKIFLTQTDQVGKAFWAALALTASLYHLVNHAAFKGLLFLCTGAVEKLTNTVEMGLLGGLALRYRWTTYLFLLGALAIAGFPPMNGFISEWLTAQSLIAGLQHHSGDPASATTRLAEIAVFILLGAAFGLTAFCFIKIFGVTFLGQPRSGTAAWKAADVPWTMRGVLIVFAGVCLALGVLPGAALTVVAPAVDTLVHTASRPLEAGLLSITVRHVTDQKEPFATVQMAPLLTIAGIGGFLAWLLSRRSSRRAKVESPLAVWSGAGAYRSAHMQVSKTMFAYWFLRWMPPHKVEPWRTQAGSNLDLNTAPFVRDEIRVSAEISVIDIFGWGWNRFLRFALVISERFGNFAQSGDVRLYLAYILLANLIVLAVFEAFQNLG